MSTSTHSPRPGGPSWPTGGPAPWPSSSTPYRAAGPVRPAVPWGNSSSPASSRWPNCPRAACGRQRAACGIFPWPPGSDGTSPRCPTKETRDTGATSGHEDPVGQQLVRRYLAAYGPAATADIRAWSGVAGLPAAVRALRDELVTFRDERGRVLLDLPDAPRPSPDTPAPVRFLPAFDNAILGYQDRGRIIDDAHLGLSVAGLRAVLVDGRVAATWTTDGRRLLVAPLRSLSAPEQEAVREEGHDLAVFLDRGIDRVDITAVRTAIG